MKVRYRSALLKSLFEIAGINQTHPALDQYVISKYGANKILGEVATEMIEQYPDIVEQRKNFTNLFKDSPELCGATCAFMATGRAKALRGMYWDCRQDIERINDVGREELQKRELYTLKVAFAEGYCNEP